MERRTLSAPAWHWEQLARVEAELGRDRSNAFRHVIERYVEWEQERSTVAAVARADIDELAELTGVDLTPPLDPPESPTRWRALNSEE